MVAPAVVYGCTGNCLGSAADLQDADTKILACSGIALILYISLRTFGRVDVFLGTGEDLRLVRVRSIVRSGSVDTDSPSLVSRRTQSTTHMSSHSTHPYLEARGTEASRTCHINHCRSSPIFS